MSKLSSEKLYELFENNGYTPSKEYPIEGSVRFIEGRSQDYQDPFLLSIPRKYTIEISKKVPSVPLELIEDEDENIEEFVDEVDEIGPEDADRITEEIERKDKVSKEKVDEDKDEEISVAEGEIDDIEEAITSSYQEENEDELPALAQDDPLREYWNHLERYIPCVDSVPYSLAVIGIEGISCLTSDRSRGSFRSLNKQRKHRENTELMRLVPVIDLEEFYPKVESFGDELSKVIKGISKVSNTLRNKQLTTSLESMASLEKTCKTKTSKLEAKIKEYQQRSDTVSKLLRRARGIKATMLKKLEEFSNQHKGSSMIADLYIDIDTSVEKGKIGREMSKVDKLVKELEDKLSAIKDRINYLSLVSDFFIGNHSKLLLELSHNFSEFEDIYNRELDIS